MGSYQEYKHLEYRNLIEVFNLIYSGDHEDTSNVNNLFNNTQEDWSAEPEALEILYHQVRTQKPRTIVEIGTYKGVSSSVMCKAIEKNMYGTLYTIDCKSYEEAFNRLNHFEEKKILTFIKKSSVEAFKDWGRADIDLLFIDGDHSYENACIDFALWSRFLSPKGVIYMHDTRTRLLRNFPYDYIHPIDYYNIVNVLNLVETRSNQEWEGLAKLVKASNT